MDTTNPFPSTSGCFFYSTQHLQDKAGLETHGHEIAELYVPIVPYALSTIPSGMPSKSASKKGVKKKAWHSNLIRKHSQLRLALFYRKCSLQKILSFCPNPASVRLALQQGNRIYGHLLQLKTSGGI